VLEKYEKKIFEWVGPYLVRIKNLRLMKFFMKIVWIEAGWMNVVSVKSMKMGYLTLRYYKSYQTSNNHIHA